MKILSIIVLILLILTTGCGFAIHKGGAKFKAAIGGHMALGILTLVFVIALVIYVFLKK